MMRLAIRGTGDKETGKKLIETLELLGGVNKHGFLGDHERCFYFIDNQYLIWCEFEENMIVCHYQTHTLESFNDKYPYRPGDTVRLKDGPVFNITGIRWSNGTIVYDGVITSYFMPLETTVWPKQILHKIDNAPVAPVADVNNNTTQVTQVVDNAVIKYNYPIEGMYQIKKDGHVYYDVMSGYEVVENNGAVEVKKIKPKYPKTYEECCDILGIHYNIDFDTHYADYDVIFDNFYKLLICRDAYWRIAGEQMALCKSWAPDWTDEKQDKYGMYDQLKNTIINPGAFVFPTGEMLDAFYENFKELIDKCKAQRKK